jgi:ABC-type transport system involved in multi-copper enzyme maturation permease subunit
MKALIQKELRENLKLAVLGLGILALILALNAQKYSTILKNLGGISESQQVYLPWQPLVSSDILIGFFCAIFGAVLGWFQIHNESHRDLWAFLIHRPTTRTEIFLGKVIAGLMLYVLATGLPLIGFIAWALVPGHVAAPFQWAMLLPTAILVLSGILYYFAGMLTGLRQARWYASRALGVGVALFVSVTFQSEPHLWQALVFILIGGIILATAVWGSFYSHGFYRGQPAPGRLALTGALMPGWGFVLALTTILLVESLLRNSNSYPQLQYQMTKDGTIYKVTHGNGDQSDIVDLEGKPLIDSKTGRTIGLVDFGRRECTQVQINPDFSDRAPRWRWFDRDCNRFTFWRATPDTLWYYWNKYGRLVGYDIATRRLIGSLGPDGFAPNLSGDGSRLGDGRNNNYPAVSRRIINTADTVYALDLEHRATKAIFTITNTPNETIGGIGEVSLNGYDWDYTIVVTRSYVRLLTPDGKAVWQFAYKSNHPAYGQITVAFLDSRNQFALWLVPSGYTQEKTGWKLPMQVTWLDREQGVLKSTDLPVLFHNRHDFARENKLISLSISPMLMVMTPLTNEQPRLEDIPWVLVKFSLVAALICIPVGWWLGCRYNLSVPARLGWAAFHLGFGIPGLLTFLSVQEWPAREACPNCKKLRTVDREKCEHCGADLAPPEKNGTEIFEPLEATRT